MKVSSSETIKTSEKDLIDAIAGELDWEAIENLFREKHHLTLEDELEYKDGDIVIHENQIAYKLNFDIKVQLSVLFDRNGECLDVSTNENEENDNMSDKEEEGDDLTSEKSVPAGQGGDTAEIEINEITGAGEDEIISDIAHEVAVMIPDDNTNSNENGFD